MKNSNGVDVVQKLLAEPLPREKLLTIMEDIKKLKIGVIGDGCVDIYWHADMTLSELSRETPHHILPVVKENFSPGAGGNVAMNLKALGCKEVLFCSVIGRDWRGSILRQQFLKAGIDDSFTFVSDNWITPAYCKPIRCGLQNSMQEDARLDFVNMAPLPEEAISKLLDMIDRTIKASDAVIVNDQFKFGVIGQQVRERLSYWAKQGKLILADSRERIGLFANVIVKPNELEGLKCHRPDADLQASAWDDWIAAGQYLEQKMGAPCCMTLGEKGAVWFEHGKSVHVPTKAVEPPIDIVGAGDCFAASLLCALSVGCSGPDAISFAHLGTAVTLKKLGTTGTANPAEIIQRYDSLCAG